MHRNPLQHFSPKGQVETADLLEALTGDSTGYFLELFFSLLGYQTLGKSNELQNQIDQKILRFFSHEKQSMLRSLHLSIQYVKLLVVVSPNITN